MIPAENKKFDLSSDFYLGLSSYLIYKLASEMITTIGTANPVFHLTVNDSYKLPSFLFGRQTRREV